MSVYIKHSKGLKDNEILNHAWKIGNKIHQKHAWHVSYSKAKLLQGLLVQLLCE